MESGTHALTTARLTVRKCAEPDIGIKPDCLQEKGVMLPHTPLILELPFHIGSIKLTFSF